MRTTATPSAKSVRAARAVAPETPPAPALRPFDPRAPFLLPLALLAITRLALAAQVPWAGEDAYITFRYAWNWAHGLGPVFNAGERVFGFTSPPWMAWLAAGIRLGADPVAWARGTLLAADAAALVAGVVLLDRHASRAAAWCFAVFFAVWTYFAGLLCAGLETGAMVSLVLLAAALAGRRHAAAGVALGVLAVWRPEGLLAAAVVAVWASWRDRAIAAAIVAAVAAALAAYYGSPVPQSVLAKAAVYGAPGPWLAPHWWEWMLPLHNAGSTSESRDLLSLVVVLSPAAVAGAPALWRARRTGLAAAWAGLAVVWLALFATGAAWFFWYFAAPLVMWVLLACIGLPSLVRRPHLYGALALVVASHWIQGAKLYRGRAETEAERFGAAADWLAAHARPGDTVMLEPIGTVGWRCRDLRVIDEVGLVSPDVLARRRRGAGWYADLVDERRPGWLVLRAGVLRSREAFAGAGAPFRDEAEERRVLAGYTLGATTDSAATDATLGVLRRIAPAR